jgi:hypothetical protein
MYRPAVSAEGVQGSAAWAAAVKETTKCSDPQSEGSHGVERRCTCSLIGLIGYPGDANGSAQGSIAT